MKSLFIPAVIIGSIAGCPVLAQSQAPQPPTLDTSNLFTNSLGVINDTYRGAHPYWNDDFIGEGLGKLGEWLGNQGTAAAMQFCNYWRQNSGNWPVTGVTVTIPGSPVGVPVNLDKGCGSAQGAQPAPPPPPPTQNLLTPSEIQGLTKPLP